MKSYVSRRSFLQAMGVSTLSLALSACGGGTSSGSINREPSASLPNSSVASSDSSSANSTSNSSASEKPITFKTGKARKYIMDWKSAKYYWDYEYTDQSGDRIHATEAIDNLKNYMKENDYECWKSEEYICTPATVYFPDYSSAEECQEILIRDERIYPYNIKQPSRSWLILCFLGESIEVYNNDFKTSTITRDGKDYHCETIRYRPNSTTCLEITFYFEGDKWKYLDYYYLSRGRRTQYFITINQFTTDFDQSIFEIPSSYTVFMTSSEFTDKYILQN